MVRKLALACALGRRADRRAGRRARHQAHHRDQGIASLQRPVVRRRRPVRNVRRHAHRRGRSQRPAQRDHPGHPARAEERARHGRVHGDLLPHEADRHDEVERDPPAPGAQPRRPHRHRRPRDRRSRPLERLAGRPYRNAGGARDGAGREESRRLVDHGPVHVHHRRSRDGQPDQRRRQHGDDLRRTQQSHDSLSAGEHRYDPGGAHELRVVLVQYRPADRSAPRRQCGLVVRGLHVDAVSRARRAARGSACAAASTSRASIAWCTA